MLLIADPTKASWFGCMSLMASIKRSFCSNLKFAISSCNFSSAISLSCSDDVLFLLKFFGHALAELLQLFHVRGILNLFIGYDYRSLGCFVSVSFLERKNYEQ